MWGLGVLWIVSEDGDSNMKPDTYYEPEFGQAIFGQPWQQHEASELLIAALEYLDSELCRVMWNKHQESYDSPFRNTGNSFKNDVFEVCAYSWDDTKEQPYNFKYNDIKISWYKYLGRGTTINRNISNDEISDMLDKCLESVKLIERI